MNLENILVDIEDGIAVLTINRPKALNAINDQLMSEVGHLFSEGLDFKSLNGVIITGAGEKAFIAGADITELQNLSTEEGYKLSKKGHDIFDSIESCTIPVLAAVNGFCLGGGNELAMSCHIRIASKNAKFGQPEVNLGLIPGYGGTQRLIQYLGKGKGMDLLLTGDMINADEALHYGLVVEVVEQSELIDAAKKKIKKIAKKGPAAIAKTIQLVNAYFDKSANGFVKEAYGFGDAIGSDESTEGVSAFLEKRKAEFKK